MKRAIEEGFPIVAINRLAVPERNSFKPIYQMHKWFARRASCVFRAILLGCLKPAGTDIMAEFYKDHTDDPDTVGKVILDPFMGGGTTVVEALRLGCKVIGIDLNPVAWFIVKTEVEPLDLDELRAAFDRLADRPVGWSGNSVRETLLPDGQTGYCIRSDSCLPKAASDGGRRKALLGRCPSGDSSKGTGRNLRHRRWPLRQGSERRRTLKRRLRLDRLLAGPRWDVVVFDEAHHLSRIRYGTKTQATQNYRLAEALRAHARDLLFLSATPHQGDPYQFWSLVQLLDDSLFESPDVLLEHRGLLGRVMIRRTKREVTDAAGQPIFMRRQVHSQAFPLAVRERLFYDQLTDYLREGYGVAGLGQPATTSRQRAVGFVMATFQKIMSSSPRAIRQALRRRLLVLLAREQIVLEGRAGRSGSSPAGMADRLLHLQEELRSLAVAIHGIPASPSQRAEADMHVAQIKQRLARRSADEEATAWAIDGDEEGDEAIYAAADIPGEADKVRQLIRLVPEGTDRKFDTLLRAVEQLRRESPAERFVIFTQYRETLEFLREELGKVYGPTRIATLKGGPLDDKIAAIEAFWSDDGARFLISTSAGGEGINLQIGHILFNYDLPWNPMAVEQRIGRIHRYGQQDTVQVYNLVAEDTVEERIYRLLDEKLLEIARAIGRVDPTTGDVVEDFRSEILGFLGSSPNYQELYKKALVDRDYKRTEREMVDALEQARKASEALRTLAQDLDSFNLDQYLTIRGHFTLDHLRRFAERAILRLGGAFMPSGDVVHIETPEALLVYPRVLRSYRDATFSRELAMRRRNIQLLGLGHPLIDALIRYLQRPQQPGEVAALTVPDATRRQLSVRTVSHLELEAGRRRSGYTHLLLAPDGSWEEAPPACDVEWLGVALSSIRQASEDADLGQLRSFAQDALAAAEARLRATVDGVVSVRHREVGLALMGRRS